MIGSGPAPQRRVKKACLDTVLSILRKRGWKPGLTRKSYESITGLGFRSKTLPLAFVATQILCEEQPMTLRGLFYRVVSAGWLPSTDRAHYSRLCRLMTTLREERVVPFTWLVDHVRNTIKPSSWSGLADFADTVRDAYRKNFWASLPAYVHVFCEKDAMAGVLAPVAEEYDVPLSIIRGFVSVSFAHEVATLWNQIEKPIAAYYLGDFDPSGLSLEQDLREKLTRYCDRAFSWLRLGVCPEDFAGFNLYPLRPKRTDSRTQWFRSQGYTQCAELDAIPATALRARLEQAILAHIPTEEWERLRLVEERERASFHEVLDRMAVSA